MNAANRPDAAQSIEVAAGSSDAIEILLCGDVMTGRGIDQVLPHPGNPTLHEPVIRDARAYVALAEEVNGPIARPVTFDDIWGDALPELRQQQVDARIINLETSITTSDDAWPGKGIHYRMHPANIPCLSAAGIDCCCLANNHVLDWRRAGLSETLRTLDAAGLAHAGAGETLAEAAASTVIEVPGKGRVLVFSMGSPSSGIPWEWDATERRSGVNLLEDLSGETARRVADMIQAASLPGDLTVASIHWGENWGYHVPEDQIRFAHRLLDAGVDVVHGHSSHHVKGLEIYRDRPILYGCGDFIDDYEGISGHEAYRGDVRAIYKVRIDPRSRRLLETRIIPLRVRRFRLEHASDADAAWLFDLLNRLETSLNTRFIREQDNSLTAHEL